MQLFLYFSPLSCPMELCLSSSTVLFHHIQIVPTPVWCHQVCLSFRQVHVLYRHLRAGLGGKPPLRQ